MGRISKKIGKKRTKPPLSKLDKFIYYSGFVGAIVIPALILIVFGGIIPNKIAFSDKTVIAANSTALYFCLPLVLLCFSIIVIPFAFGLDRKQPIFGNKHFKPSPSHPTEKVYPLFTKEFRNSISRKRKRTIKIVTLIVSIICLINIIILPFSANVRYVLHQNNDCSAYNAFNQMTRKQNVDQAEKMIIEVTQNSYRKRIFFSYSLVVRFVFDDKTYSFNYESFDMSTEDTLKHMIYLKSFFKDGKYEIVNIYDIDNLIRDKSFSRTEAALVYQLFEYKQ